MKTQIGLIFFLLFSSVTLGTSFANVAVISPQVELIKFGIDKVQIAGDRAQSFRPEESAMSEQVNSTAKSKVSISDAETLIRAGRILAVSA